MSGSDLHDRYVSLRGGLIVPADAYLLALDLEARGFTLARAGEQIEVAPADKLTRQDFGAIRTHRGALLALLDYAREGGHDAHLFTDTPRGATAHA